MLWERPNRNIVHLDLDTFFVSVERLQDSRLEGKPVLVGGVSDRGVVAACSYEARAFGIHSAMPMKMARQLCPEAIVIRGDSGKYSQYSSMVTEIIKDKVPLYEKSSIDEFYIDLTGMDKFFGSYKMALEIRDDIRKETGLPISLGMSQNKTVSKVATGEAKPDNTRQVDLGTEKHFLAPLSVRKIPMVGQQTYTTLKQLGVRKVLTLQEMPVELLQKVFGKPGITLWHKANGHDSSPVVPHFERKSISLERTFDKDTIDNTRLRSIITAMAESLAYQLRYGNKLTACITVKIRYSDFSTYSKQMRIAYTSCDHTLIARAMELFDALFSRRMRVRLVGVKCSHLVQGGYQINLLDDSEEVIRLYQAMDKMRKKYGSRMVKRAVGMDVRNMESGNPFTGEPPVPPAHRTA